VILLVSPAPPSSGHGNAVTATRWAEILRQLGHPVRVAQAYDGGEYQVLVALHARKSAAAILAFHAANPLAAIVIALTGTDLYPDLAAAGVDPSVLALATRLVVLQARALDQLDPAVRRRARVIVQSAPAIPRRPPRPDCFEVAYLAHLRGVKDPLRPAAAVRLLPAGSRVRVTHAGEAIDAKLGESAAAESATNPRYDWLGALRREAVVEILARSRLLLQTSRHEGGANVLSEALAAGMPIIASAIPGSTGLLGDDYPGLFPVGRTNALAAALEAAEEDRDGYYRILQARCEALRPMVDPARERQAWAGLLTELELSVSI
jgi:putative glycosyltransferase (TIGR04348 family)